MLIRLTQYYYSTRIRLGLGMEINEKRLIGKLTNGDGKAFMHIFQTLK